MPDDSTHVCSRSAPTAGRQRSSGTWPECVAGSASVRQSDVVLLRSRVQSAGWGGEWSDPGRVRPGKERLMIGARYRWAAVVTIALLLLGGLGCQPATPAGGGGAPASAPAPA